MADEALIELIRFYAYRGVSDWGGASPDLKSRASICLGPKHIAENQGHVDRAINMSFKNHLSDSYFYIPMPAHSKKIEQAFFMPIRDLSNKNPMISFYLFIIVSKNKSVGGIASHCLAFRWEPVDRETNSHAYAHVQLCTSTAIRTLPHVEIPNWLPVSYPAVPIGSSDPINMFLLMVTSIHGYPERMETLMIEIFGGAKRVAMGHLNVLRASLGIL
jgi:hypothetical protein